MNGAYSFVIAVMPPISVGIVPANEFIANHLRARSARVGGADQYVLPWAKAHAVSPATRYSTHDRAGSAAACAHGPTGGRARWLQGRSRTFQACLSCGPPRSARRHACCYCQATCVRASVGRSGERTRVVKVAQTCSDGMGWLCAPAAFALPPRGLRVSTRCTPKGPWPRAHPSDMVAAAGERGRTGAAVDVHVLQVSHAANLGRDGAVQRVVAQCPAMSDDGAIGGSRGT